MSRPTLWAVCIPALFLGAVPALAQTRLDAQTGQPPQTIDIRVETAPEEQAYDDCEEDQDAAVITGEIIVCRKKSGGENRLYDKETAETRHAQRTQGAQPVDVAGAGIFRGEPTVGGLCFIPPCPKDPVYLIDFAELPDTPPGSDADRVARGLAPRGNRTLSNGAIQIAGEAEQQGNAAELGLPPPLEAEEVNPSGSASPEGEPPD